jgi:hypothetical protein
VHVIDVPRRVQGKVLRVYMNADLDEAIGVLSTPSGKRPTSSFRRRGASLMVEGTTDEHWRWRQRMVERLARQIDTKKFGIKAFYVFGSTKNGTAGPGSDIDVLLHVEDKSVATGELSTWLKGWSQALDEINFLRTGYHAGGLLDVHFVDDDDVRNRTSYAAKIGAVTDAAREVPLGGSGD